MLLKKLKTLKNSFNLSKEPFCYAPFGSMYFTQNGDVVACCKNRMYLLGKYPEKSVEQIWKGEKIQHLRNCIISKDLSHGCFGCSPSSAYSHMNNLQYSFLSNKNKYPEYLIFQLSNICNLECKMCNYENSVNQTTVNFSKNIRNCYDDNFVEQIGNYLPYVKQVSFLGGETFLINIYYDLWESIVKINNKIIINVLSNGTVYNNRVENILAKGNFLVSLSIDSFNKENYEKIRKNASFDLTMENLKHFSDYMKKKGEKLIIDVCLMKDNLDEMPSIFEYCNKMNFDIFINNVIWPQDSSLKYLTSQALKSAVDHLNHYNNIIDWQRNSVNEKMYRRIINTVESWYREAVEYEQSDLFKTNDNEVLQKLLISKLMNFISNEMKYLNQVETESVINNLNIYIEKLKPFLISDDELTGILKNLQRIPLYEIITELMVSEENTVIDRFLMFK